MEPIIEVKNIGKKYSIAHEQEKYVALRDVLTNIISNPLPFLKSRAQKAAGAGAREDFWALRGIDFSVNKGEVVGIIGHNGAGKSTLLKILSQITPPTEGEIIIRGSIGSLLEVGTGFHPELTGRENIFLNGAILGMGRREITAKFDQIVEFAGIGKFLDTPVKRYSSGMYVRLAFSVAAHMEPDILLIDEVLAVGDAEFQKKCLGKMEEITKEDGRTIIFVSHNLNAIRSICPKAILLSRGKVEMVGETNEVINHYLNYSEAPDIVVPHKATKDLSIKSIRSANHIGQPWTFAYGEDIVLEIELENRENLPAFQAGLGINSLQGERILSVHNDERDLPAGTHRVRVRVKNSLTPGSYSFGFDVLNRYFLPDFAMFHIVEHGKENAHQLYNLGLVDAPATFEFL
jgi:lipopolysaccharide transport system ATP-binding protein